MKERASGILLHISSLPSAFGIGDLGQGAYRFVDFLAQAKQNFWQVLPLNPTNLINDNSPYSSESAFAYNTLFISPELLVEDGLLTQHDLDSPPEFSITRVDYKNVIDYKNKLFDLAYKNFNQEDKDRSDYKKFCKDNREWLDDFSLFDALKEHFQGKLWSEWPLEVRDRDEAALKKFTEELKPRIEKEKLLQYLFFKQWVRLKKYCHEKGVQVIGDVPIYVTYDSVDVWTNPGIFKLNKEKKLAYVAGVPPDYFSKTGQLWGNPVYRWDVLKENDYQWWVQRMEHNFSLFDWVRADHFRGFVGYWQVAASEETAINGKWQPVPAKHFFETLLNKFNHLAIIAEDLGIITDDVKQIMHQFGFPGMKVLLFAFGEDNPRHPYLPHNYTPNCVVYTGTHDNNTMKGWFEKEASEKDKQRLFAYLGQKVSVNELNWELIRLAMMSVANMAIFPIQDVLNLGQIDRMNLPGTKDENWQWRLAPEQIDENITQRLSMLTRLYGRIKE